MPGTKQEMTLYCSFCGKSQHEVESLIVGPTVFICEECIATSIAIIINDHAGELVTEATEDGTTYSFKYPDSVTEKPPT